MPEIELPIAQLPTSKLWPNWRSIVSQLENDPPALEKSARLYERGRAWPSIALACWNSRDPFTHPGGSDDRGPSLMLGRPIFQQSSGTHPAGLVSSPSPFKPFFHYLRMRRWNWGLFFSAGGMPSSHSALITAVTFAIGFQVGFD